MHTSFAVRRCVAVAAAAVVVCVQSASAQRPAFMPKYGPARGPAPGTALVATGVARPAPPAASPAAAKTKPYDPQRLLAGHLLRRIGFGPTPEELQRVLSIGREAYIDEQLNPGSIDDSAGEARFFPVPDPLVDDFGYSWTAHWFTRMAYSRRQLLERMTLVWHEHFPVSIGKIGQGKPLHDYEEVLRSDALGSFRQMLVDITKNDAMLIYLDNNYNFFYYDDNGNPVAPNENYARELLQLFTLGTERLNMDGTPMLGDDGQPLPNYTEDDVREVARAMTGWYIDDYDTWAPSKFYGDLHDPRPKTFLGVSVPGRSGADGAREIEDVVDAIMRHPSTAPFISKELIEKLATETPTPGYVERVATVFKSTSGDLKQTVRAILTDPEFTSDAVVRSQFKEPIDTFMGPIRALGGDTQGLSLYVWSYFAHQLPYYPPSVFSFYRPGKRAALVTASQVAYLDLFADDFVDTYTDPSYTDATFDAAALIRANNLKKPKKTVDFLADRLLAAPLEDSTRKAIVDYMGRSITEEKLRGAVWLIITSPDFQLN
jgi:uncharacterized protein (DUF1800 family)